MTFYELLLSLHVITSIIWLGAGFVFFMLILGAQRAGNAAKEAGYAEDIEWLTTRLFIPASLATFILGVLLVIDGSWDLGELWIVIGLLGWLASFLLGILYFKPQSERMAALTQEHGPAYPEVRRRARTVSIVERFQLMILFLIPADMVIKPTGDDTGVLIIGVLILLATGALSFNALRKPATA